MVRDDKKPVYIIYGFLESGKTQFMNYTISQDYFQMEEPSLLIVCEEGVEEYDEVELKKYNTKMVVIEEKEDFTLEKLASLDEEYKPSRILIEYNGMWDCKNLQFPKDWEIAQQITMADFTTFENYFNNMRSMFADMVRNSEMVIMNRCKDVDKLNGYKRSITALNTNIDVVFEDGDGEVDIPLTDEDLPYDLKADLVEIGLDDYGIFYLDLWQTISRYENKRFHLKTMVMKEPSLPKNFFVAGRPAMTCCADDIVFMGLVCQSRESKNLVDKDTVDIIATVKNEYRNDYGGYGPVLYAESLEKTIPMKDPLVKIFG
ncbi:MAG: GTPase [Clostridiales bacterium]|nr:GTPase [Clostridiales bacterium]